MNVVLENPEEVFVYQIYEGNYGIGIQGYIGNAKYLKIPTMIEGYYVDNIGTNAFKETTIVEIEIPNSVLHVQSLAFSDSDTLEKVSFYGDYYGFVFENIPAPDYENFIQENLDVCVKIPKDEDDQWSFSEGCPISEVLGKTEVVEFNGIEYFSYKVIFDLRFYEEFQYNLRIMNKAFYNLDNLNTVVFNDRFSVYFYGIFENTPSLSTINFSGDNSTFEVVDGVIYSKDLEDLIFYPPGKESKDFVVPDRVKTIWSGSFYQNQNIKRLFFGEFVEEVSVSAFHGMKSLEEFIVENNPVYEVRDGVLFSINDNEIELVKYPSAKPGDFYIVPIDVIALGYFAFSDNLYLESINLNQGLKFIGEYAFTNTSKIKLLNVPATVEFIGYASFLDSSIETLIINRSVLEDGSITKVHSLTRLSEIPTIYVPDDSYDEYLKDQFWQVMSDSVKLYSEYNK